MNVANYKLSEELYKLSGWTTNRKWVPDLMNHGFLIEDGDPLAEGACPAYDLGFLLQKLPPERESRFGTEIELTLRYDGAPGWVTEYTDGNFVVLEPYSGEADTPEDAAAKLAIALFKANILVKGETK